jgi:rhodanese-related sulfurtransferase
MSRKWLIAIIIFIGVYVFSQQSLKGGPEVSVKEAVGLMSGAPRAVVIDVRERAEYEKDRLPGAISVPSAEFKARLESLKLPKVDPIVLYGDDDVHVREATRLLYESGYQGALTLKGGMAAWRAAGQALEKPQASKPN